MIVVEGAVNPKETIPSWEEVEANAGTAAGGHWRPVNCIARQVCMT